MPHGWRNPVKPYGRTIRHRSGAIADRLINSARRTAPGPAQGLMPSLAAVVERELALVEAFSRHSPRRAGRAPPRCCRWSRSVRCQAEMASRLNAASMSAQAWLASEGRCRPIGTGGMACCHRKIKLRAEGVAKLIAAAEGIWDANRLNGQLIAQQLNSPTRRWSFSPEKHRRRGFTTGDGPVDPRHRQPHHRRCVAPSMPAGGQSRQFGGFLRPIGIDRGWPRAGSALAPRRSYWFQPVGFRRSRSQSSVRPRLPESLNKAQHRGGSERREFPVGWKLGRRNGNVVHCDPSMVMGKIGQRGPAIAPRGAD